MRLYKIAPVIPADAESDAVDARLTMCIDPITDLVVSLVAEDPALFALRHCDEMSDRPKLPTKLYHYAEAAEIPDATILRELIRECVDPFSGKWSLVRSLVTCRAVNFGYDGQAYVCLPTDESEPKSPEPSLISVEDVSNRLLETDLVDGIFND